MRVIIASIGRFREGPEKQLWLHYALRIPWKIDLKEIELKKELPPAKRVEEEGRLLLEACDKAQKRVLLDERGRDLASAEFAKKLQDWQVQGQADIAFLIGGADGVSPGLRKQADLMLSFGRVSWPHLLMRALLAEQLYRAHTLMTGHPYHRAGN